MVRLWEDLLELLPVVLEPVPADLLPFVESEPNDWHPADTPESEAASGWHSDHYLYVSYLRSAPNIRWWRSGGGAEDLVTVTWRPHHDGNVEFSRPPSGRITIPTAELITAIRDFDGALFTAMEQRVTDLEHGGPPQGVALDLGHLRHEQRDRAAWLERALSREDTVDWAAVRVGSRERLMPG